MYSTTNMYPRFSSAGNYHILLIFFSIFYIILYILSLPRKKKLSYDSIFSFPVSISTLNGARTCTSARTHKRQYIFFPSIFFFTCHFLSFSFSLRLLEMSRLYDQEQAEESTTRHFEIDRCVSTASGVASSRNASIISPTRNNILGLLKRLMLVLVPLPLFFF